MMALSHQNILKAHQVYETSNSIYILMENLEGGSFRSQLTSTSSKLIPEQEIYEYMTSLLKALKHMAKHDIMHRDVKPDNLAFRNSFTKELILVDFGLASICNSKEYAFKRCGTPGFSSPEVLSFKGNKDVRFTPKVDVFSAGVIFFRLYLSFSSSFTSFLSTPKRWTGKYPFNNPSRDITLKQNQQCIVNFEEMDNMRDSLIAIDLAKKLMEPNPKDRLSAFEALLHPYFIDSPFPIQNAIPKTMSSVQFLPHSSQDLSAKAPKTTSLCK